MEISKGPESMSHQGGGPGRVMNEKGTASRPGEVSITGQGGGRASLEGTSRYKPSSGTDRP